MFCAGANIQMLAGSTHGHKVNFCKFTNETRNAIEDATAHSGQTWIAAVNGTAAGGGYELALACDEILLIDDRASAVSLPEVPLLAVLPGTGGLTRVVDKRHVRRDLADVFATRAEGVKGQQAVDWGLVDAIAPRSRFDDLVRERRRGPGRRVGPPGRIGRRRPGPAGRSRSTATRCATRGHVDDRPHRRRRPPHRARRRPAPSRQRRTSCSPPAPTSGCWRRARQLDDAMLRLRFNEPELGTWVLHTAGDAAAAAGRRGAAGRPRRPLARAGDPPVLGADAAAARPVGPHDRGAGRARELLRRHAGRAGAGRRPLVHARRPGPRRASSHRRRSASPPPTTAGTRCRTASAGWRTRFWGRDDDLVAARDRIGKDLLAADAVELGLVTFTPDEIDWDDEVRLTLEERNSFSPDALTGMEANFRFVGPETMETKIFARLSAWQNWIFQRPNAVGPEGALRRFGTGSRPTYDRGTGVRRTHDGVDIDARIPNNVDLAGDRRLQRALESWQPRFIEWWKELGPVAFQDNDVYLRTAISVGQEGWANFGARQDARLPLGHLPRRPDARPPRRLRRPPRRARCGRRCPGEYRADLRRLIVVQGDTEPASVEQQRALCLTAPSLYDLRNLFQINVEEGRHLWAMVYLLHRYFGRDGRDEADEMLERHSGDADHPRILGAFNEPTPDWLSFFFFTYFTDRDGKFQLASLRESGFDPLSRTCDFMLKEEAHHMFVGATGIGRVVQRTVELMKQHDTADVASVRRDRRRDAAALPELPLQRVARPVRRRDVDERGQLLRRRAEGPVPGGRRDDDHRLHDANAPSCRSVVDGAIATREATALPRSTRRCATTTSPTARRASTAGTAASPRSASS